MMKNFKIILVSLIMGIVWDTSTAQPFQNTLELIEAGGAPTCGQLSSCTSSRVCFDIWVTPDTTGIILSYNIWLDYNFPDLSYQSDNACLTNNGTDNNFNSLGLYRVSGIQGGITVTEGVPVKLHNVCFTYTSIAAIDGDLLIVGGSPISGAHSTLTYNTNPPLNEPMMPAYPITLSDDNVSCILPVKWLTFEASKRGETSLLEWTTVEEFNNKGFDVMRSTDGKNFEKIGWVDAAKVPQTVNRYQFIDEHPRRGVNYYQLKQWDHDGRFDYSPVRTVTFSDRNFAVSVTPNPASEFFLVDIQSEFENSMISLIDVTGRVVLTEEVTDRNIIARLPVDGLPSGAYTLMVESGAERFIEQVIIIE